MKTEQEGIVIEVIGHIAKVKISRHSECKNCGACPGGDQAIVLEAQNLIGAKLGQRVFIEIKTTNVLKAAFVVYIIPLIAIFLGAICGGWLARKNIQLVQVLQIAGGIIAFVIAVLFIKFFDKSTNNNKKIQPTIKRIL
ncbi:hypothetical protein CPJCM30710_23570 [Clostridium polyendosporum]|uniref:Positive regulator of sigma(E), RseC/MucC n=1 Tax=Clostridium polyendosporum TaxID=69208 RepID=A0A919S0H1_9CLOT|nr:SoxR reducing system RseC family protein [Clostridium polyendosporum]GIM29691.1 hypothetical protein CPJCM30710_23570 [Clostridium polyendosporum]